LNSYLALLRANRNFRNLWLAGLISYLGDWFNLLASAALIARLTDSGTAISYLFLARFLPIFLFSPLAGVLADRYDRRHVMIATDVLRALTVIGFIFIRSSSQIWIFYLLTVTQFALSALFIPARSAVLPNVVDEEDLVTANALDGFTWSTMLALGAMLGGVAAALFGATTAFLLDAATFLLSAWFVARVVVPARSTLPETADSTFSMEPAPSSGLFAFVDGLRYLRGRPFILVIALAKAGGSLIWGALNVLEVPLSENVFPIAGNGTWTLGILLTTTGIGTGIGPLLLRHWLGDAPDAVLRGIGISFALLTAGLLGWGLAPNLVGIITATLLRGIGGGSIWVFSAVLLQTLVTDRMRGRVFAFEFAALTLAQSASVLWAGVAQDALGLAVQEVALVAGGISLVVTLLWLIFQMRNTARLRAGVAVGD